MDVGVVLGAGGVVDVILGSKRGGVGDVTARLDGERVGDESAAFDYRPSAREV